MSTAPTEVDDLRREMARIRRDMHLSVQGVVASAEAVTDWHRYLTAYPWLTVGAAFAVGYFVVPKRKGRKLEEAVERAVNASSVAKAQVREAVIDPPKVPRKSLIGAAFAMVVPLALRAAQGYALKYAENWLAEQTAAMQPSMTFPPQPGARNPQAGGPGPQAGGPRPRAV